MIALPEPVFSGSRRAQVTFIGLPPAQEAADVVLRRFHSASTESVIVAMSPVSIGKFCRMTGCNEGPAEL